MREQEVKVLNEVYKGCEMGIEALDEILPKVYSEKFQMDLTGHKKDLKELKNEIEDYMERSNELPTDTGIWKELMLKGSTKWNLMMDPTTSHIAEMLIQGGNMGVITARKLLNESSNLDAFTKQLTEKFIRLEENNNEKMKQYL